MESKTAWFDISILPEEGQMLYGTYILKQILPIFKKEYIVQNSKIKKIPKISVFHGDLPADLIGEVCGRQGIYSHDPLFIHLTQETEVFGLCFKAKTKPIIAFFESQLYKLKIPGFLWAEGYFSDPDQGYSGLIHAFDLEDDVIRLDENSIYIEVFEDLDFKYETF